ncbi:effector-associated constant component EACC1 [Streptomyces sp. CA-111067]|uniref:effector-associated constant component EACC1 n=1 Tax=Streptomyces sp. CA-111067 TaxID=3240046 RepID=UPI003D952FA0
MDVLLGLVPDSAASAEESERLAIRLRAELRELDLDTCETVAGGAPPARSKGDAVAAGAVVLALSVPGGVLPSLIGLVQDWLGRQASRNRVSITLNGNTVEGLLTPEQQQQLIDAIVDGHQADGE